MLIAVTIYLCFLLLVGVRRGRHVRTGDDFFVAGRTLPARVLVLHASLHMGRFRESFAGAGLGYRVGFAALWQSAGAWVGIMCVYFIAPRVRRIAQYTVPDILEMRYGSFARVPRDYHNCPSLLNNRRLPISRRWSSPWSRGWNRPEHGCVHNCSCFSNVYKPRWHV